MATHTHFTISVGVRELHNRTSELMKAVAEGADLEVTNHGKVVGRMKSVQVDSPYERLKREGMIREAEIRDDWLPEPVTPTPGPPISDLVKDQQM